MKLYHIHRNNNYDDLYYEGNTLVFGKTPNQMYSWFLSESSDYDERIEIEDDKTICYHRDLADVLDIDVINKMSDEEKKNLVKKLHAYVQNTKINFREMILEEVRLKSFPTRPSRYTCMWLTDKDGIDEWYKKLHRPSDGEYKIFEVEADGNIFLSSSLLLPHTSFPHEKMYGCAYRYWNPDDRSLKVIESREYLLEGQARLVKRVK
jgi:hypothetical protein